MIPVLTLFNDFLPGNWCQKLRSEILADGFTTEMVDEAPGHPPAAYHTVNMKRDMGEMFIHIGMALGQIIIPVMHAFRLGADKSPVHNFVHADHTCASLAAVYYLNPPDQCQGGTAFWRHRKHGWEFQPTTEELTKAGYTIEQLKEDWQDPEAWDMVTLAGMKTNRLIVYPTQAFHSRWPIEGFGDPSKPETCRIIWAGFFNVK